MTDVKRKNNKKAKSIKVTNGKIEKLQDKQGKDKAHGKNYLRTTMMLIIILSIGVLLGVISYTVYNINGYNSLKNHTLSYREIDASVQVVPYGAGMDGNRSVLKFGKIGLGGGSTKYIQVNTSESAIVQIYASGDIADFIGVDDNNFTIRPGNMMIPIYLDVPENAAIGNYTGKVHILLLRPQ
jgi:hypothetical protein